MFVIGKEIRPRYANKWFLLKARHPKLHDLFQQRILIGYVHVEFVGICPECKSPIYSDEEYVTDEDGECYCDELCKKWYLERL